MGNTGSTTTDPVYYQTGGYNGKGAFYFDGVDDYINCGHSSNIQIFTTNNWSLSFWAKVTGSGDPNQDIIQGAVHKPRVYTNIATRNLYLTAFVSSVYTALISITSAYSYDTWFHTVIVADSTLYKMYINGALVSSVAYQKIDPSFANFLIASNGSTGESFRGFVDDVRIYAIALSSSEIEKLYAESKDKYLSKN